MALGEGLGRGGVERRESRRDVSARMHGRGWKTFSGKEKLKKGTTWMKRYNTAPAPSQPEPTASPSPSTRLVVDLQSSSQLSADELLERFRRYRAPVGMVFSSPVPLFHTFAGCV